MRKATRSRTGITRRETLAKGGLVAGSFVAGGSAVGTVAARGRGKVDAVAYTYIPIEEGDTIPIHSFEEEDIVRRCEGKNGKHKVDRYSAGGPGQNILLLSQSVSQSDLEGSTIEVVRIIKECDQNRAVKFQFEITE